MAAVAQFDENEIRKAIAMSKADNELFEIRVISDIKSNNMSGYFTDAETLINELKKVNVNNSNVYITLNRIKDACYDRPQKNALIKYPKNTTNDNDITNYDWLMVDVDPKRPAGTSSTDEQIREARDIGNKIYTYMNELGFEKPLMALSGNGVHLLYRIDLENTADNRKIVEKSLKALDMLFSTDGAQVDKANFNPSRICKLYGTVAHKGANSAERPHRLSRIVSNTDAEIKVTPKEYLEKLCKVIPETEKPQQRANVGYTPRDFNLDEWLSKYGLNYKRTGYSGGTKYILDCCPFDSNHKGKDACIFQGTDGAIGFHCFHNSCADKKWKDVRLLFEPDAYEHKQYYEDRQMFQSYNRNKKPEPTKIVPKPDQPVFFTAKDILDRPKQTEEIIKSGIEIFDKQHRGFRKKDVTILSGYTGGAKSTLLSQLILNAVDAGNNVACFSGELAEDDYFRWMNLQAAGKGHVEPTQYENYYNVPKDTRRQIAEWLEGHFWLYNNKYGFKFEAILEQLEKMIDTHKLDMLCIDNLMALDISILSRDKYDAQGMFAWRIHELAQNKNVHIVIVCHPKKPTGLLGLYDISGTSDIVNAVDNIMYVYRVNQTFKNYYSLFYGRDFTDDCTNTWHCCKVRNGSVDDKYHPLYYEIESKRLKNSVSEYRKYGWDKSNTNSQTLIDGFNAVPDNMEIPF